MFIIFIILLVLLSFQNVFSQDSIYTLSPVEVTGLRESIYEFQSYNLIKKDDIQRGETGLTLEESLANIPGITIINRHNPSMGDKISVRGIGSRASFGVRGIKLILDNIPLTMPDGQTQTNNIDLMSAGSIDILKGPASSFYGNASGGVVRLYTEVPSGKVINIEPRILAGSDELYKYTLKLSGTLGRHSYLVSFNNTNYEGYRDHSAQKSYHLNSTYRNKIDENIILSAVLNYFNSPYQLNPSSLDKVSAEENPRHVREYIKQQGAGQRTSQFQGGVSLNYIANHLNIESTLYYIGRSLLNPIPGRIIDLKRNAGGLRSTVNKSLINENVSIELTGGVDVEYQSDNRKEFINEGVSQPGLRPSDIFDNLIYGGRLNNQKENITAAGPFAAAELIWNNRIGLLTVLRYDYFNYRVTDYLSDNTGSRVMKQLSPSAGIMYRPDVYSRVFFNYSTSFQTPTAAELSNRPDGKGGFNPDLLPEKITQFELGGEYLLEAINSHLSISVYMMNFDDLLIPYQSAVSEEIYYRNAGKAVNKGLEIKADVNIMKNLTAVVSYNNMDFTFDDYLVNYNGTEYQLHGNKVPGVPLQNVSMELSYNTPSGLWSKVSLQWNDEYYTNDFNGPPTAYTSPSSNFFNESYIYSDIRVGYLFDFGELGMDIFAGINNIADVRYNASVVPNAAGERYFEPSPGRVIFAGINLIL